MRLWYWFEARDSQQGGKRLLNLQPRFVAWNLLDTNLPIVPPPAIVEIGCGLYKFAYDAAKGGDAIGQVDLLAGGNVTVQTLTEADRFVTVWACRESSRILESLPVRIVGGTP